MKLTGRDVIAGVRDALGIKPECPIRSVTFETPLNGAATLNVSVFVTTEMLEQLAAATKVHI